MAVTFWRRCRTAGVLSMERRWLEPNLSRVLSGNGHHLALHARRFDPKHLDKAEQRRVKALEANRSIGPARPNAGGRRQRQFIGRADLHLRQPYPLWGPLAGLLCRN